MDCIYRAYRDLLTNHGHLVERLVCGKMNKQQFLDAEVNLSKKKELLAEKLNQLVASIWEGKEKNWSIVVLSSRIQCVMSNFMQQKKKQWKENIDFNVYNVVSK